MSDKYWNLSFNFKIVLLFYIIFLFYLYIGNYIDNYAMLILFIFFLIMLYIIASSDTNIDKEDKMDKFANTDVDAVIDNVLLDPTQLDMNKDMTNKQRVIKELNDGRYTEGRFYVDCHQCGRARLLDDR